MFNVFSISVILYVHNLSTTEATERPQVLSRELNWKNVPVQPLPGPLVIDCIGNMPTDVRTWCDDVAMRKWNVTREHKGPFKNFCCYVWDHMDYLDEIVKIKCPDAEVRAVEDYFTQMQNWTQQVNCSDYPYHSNKCTLESGPQLIMVQNVEESYVDVVFPAKPYASKSEAPIATKQMKDDYNDFLMNYIQNVFPHLLNLLILLVIIMATVILMQCFILARQVKQDRLIAAAVSISEMNKLNI